MNFSVEDVENQDITEEVVDLLLEMQERRADHKGLSLSEPI